MDNKSSCCGTGTTSQDKTDYEIVRMEKPKKVCQLCEDYAAGQMKKPVAVLCCEGSCLRGEVARQAANLLCHSLARDKTVRICLGGAFTKDTGQRELVRSAGRVIALEGCYINCASRMMSGVIDGLSQEVIVADQLYDFDRKLFSIEELPEAEIKAHARTVAIKVAESL